MFRISSSVLYFIMVLFDALFCVHIMFVLYNVNQLVILVSYLNVTVLFLITCSDVTCLEIVVVEEYDLSSIL
ncbi:uncharacterized protein V1513DRAFT_297163 [Lipomyces chichibuensis]|uniref:uncharacterized protein n=1 Tax=Lipomyces chichibuensis TaxID=1546026 RepID=UPI003343B041